MTMTQTETTALYDILNKCTAPVRKGAPVITTEKEWGSVTEVFLMPSEADLDPEIEVEVIDLHFISIAVHKAEAEARREAFKEWARAYPEPEHFKAGTSYITVAREIGVEQETVFRLFGLGAALGLWTVMVPSMLGVPQALADQMAGQGMIGVMGDEL